MDKPALAGARLQSSEARMIVDAVRLLLFPTIMAVAASSDLITMTISNRLSIAPGGRLFRPGDPASGATGSDVALHVGAAMLVLVVTFSFFVCGWIGGGDAKLAAATALWLGFDHLMTYLVYASLSGGADAAPCSSSGRSRAAPANRSGLAAAPAPEGRRRAVWNCARCRCAPGLSRDAVDEGPRNVTRGPRCGSRSGRATFH